MIKPVLAEFISDILPGARQTSESSKFYADETFRDIFNSIKQSENAIDERPAHEQAAAREDRPRHDDGGDTNTENRNADAARETRETPAEEAYKAEQRSVKEAQDKPERDEKVEKPDTEAVTGKETDDSEDQAADAEDVIEELKKLLAKLAGANPEEAKGLMEKLRQLATGISQKLDQMSEADHASLRSLMDKILKAAGKDKGASLGLDEAGFAKLIELAGSEKEISGKSDKKALTEILARLAGQTPKESGADKKTDAESFADTVKKVKVVNVNKAANASDQAKAAASQNAAFNKTAEAETQAQNAARNAAKNGAQQTVTQVKPGANPEFGQNTAGNNGQSKADQVNAAQMKEKPAAPRQAFERAIMDQVVRKVRVAVRPNGSSTMSIRLDPPHLGKVDMRVKVQDNVVKAILVVESREVRSVIENNMDSLKASLNNQGLKVDQINVTTSGDQGQNQRFAGEFDTATGHRQPGHSKADNQTVTAADEELANINYRASAHNGVLDVVA